jgi:predicted RNA-binding Zn-ribbon protein involved in translation (DUF1610 family)
MAVMAMENDNVKMTARVISPTPYKWTCPKCGVEQPLLRMSASPLLSATPLCLNCGERVVVNLPHKGGDDYIHKEIARVARLEALEEAARACENIGKEIVCPEECAAAIRDLGEADDDS